MVAKLEQQVVTIGSIIAEEGLGKQVDPNQIDEARAEIEQAFGIGLDGYSQEVPDAKIDQVRSRVRKILERHIG